MNEKEQREQRKFLEQRVDEQIKEVKEFLKLVKNYNANYEKIQELSVTEEFDNALIYSSINQSYMGCEIDVAIGGPWITINTFNMPDKRLFAKYEDIVIEKNLPDKLINEINAYVNDRWING